MNLESKIFVLEFSPKFHFLIGGLLERKNRDVELVVSSLRFESRGLRKQQMKQRMQRSVDFERKLDGI